MDNDIKELKDLVTEVRICMAKIETNQHTYQELLNSFKQERTKTYDIMTQKIDAIEDEVSNLDRKLNYAVGIVTGCSVVFSFFMTFLQKKLGVI